MSQGCGGSAGRQESLTPVYSPLSLEGNGRLVPGSVQRGDQLVRGLSAGPASLLRLVLSHAHLFPDGP